MTAKTSKINLPLTLSAAVPVLLVTLAGARLHLTAEQGREKPEFRTVSWLAMLFAAGTGVGLIFSSSRW